MYYVANTLVTSIKVLFCYREVRNKVIKILRSGQLPKSLTEM